MRANRHAVRVEAGLSGSQRREARAWPRWLGLTLLLVLVVIIALAAALAVTVLYLARGTPALASLLQGVPAQTTVIYDSAGKPIAELHGSVNRVIVTGSRLPLSLKRATVAVEDKRFYSDFHGIDLAGVARAALADLRAGRALQGASTITEQYVKNAYLGGYDDSLTLKIREAILGLGAHRPLVEGAHPDGLSEHRLLRRRRLRGPGGCRDLLPQRRRPAHAGAVGVAGRPAAGSQRLLADLRSRRRPGPTQRRARRIWPARATSPQPRNAAP